MNRDIEGNAIPMRGLNIGYLPQEPQLNPEHTVRQAVEEGLGAVVTAKKRLDEVYAAYAEPDADFDALAAEQAELEAIIAAAASSGADDIEPQMEIAADALRLPPWDAIVGNLSGGEKRRVGLCRLLLSKPDMLLLDEPTNHLDLDAMLWLEKWLAAYPGTVMLISHDTEFLDAVAKSILHFDHAKLVRYRGGYGDFLTHRAERLRQTNIAYERQTRETARLQGFIDRFKAKASKAKQAQSRVKALARMQVLAPLQAEAGIDIRIPSPEQVPDPLLTLEHLSAGYTDAAGNDV
ncbi:ATP-binding cassette domain-containing protein, partial [Piscirickettsia salmonis]|uniref:ATP-binding cassette domain-containing protein n=1 Tax=Piscirickettsia salmonis TaxID=1238 RepID=UPI00211D6E6B